MLVLAPTGQTGVFPTRFHWPTMTSTATPAELGADDQNSKRLKACHPKRFGFRTISLENKVTWTSGSVIGCLLHSSAAYTSQDPFIEFRMLSYDSYSFHSYTFGSVSPPSSPDGKKHLSLCHSKMQRLFGKIFFPRKPTSAIWGLQHFSVPNLCAPTTCHKAQRATCVLSMPQTNSDIAASIKTGSQIIRSIC